MRQELTYPHFSLCQGGGFVSVEVTFNQLMFEQFVAGETETILSVHNKKEKKGRLRLLSKITRWRLRPSVSWPQLHNAYAVILRDIENEYIIWDTDFNAYQYLLTKRINTKMSMQKDRRSDGTWFCKAFQCPEGCTKDSPHIARIATESTQFIIFALDVG